MRNRLIVFGCGAVAFAVYVATTSRAVPGGDSGELIAAAYTLGLPHPPGFPLYVMLVKAFTLLPLGPVAWEANLFSGVCDALAAALICDAVFRWTANPWAGAFAALAFAFSPFVWPGAVTAEVFALNNLLVAGMIAIAVRVTRARSPQRNDRLAVGVRSHERLGRLAPLAMFTLGLGLSNHPAFVFVGIPLALYVIAFESRPLREARGALLLTAAFALGLTTYLYLPAAAASGSSVAWGDPTTWDGFMTHVLRREYGMFQLASGGGTRANPLASPLASFVTRFGSGTWWLGPLLVAMALAALARRGVMRRLLAVLVATLVVYVVTFSALSNLDLAVPLYVRIQDRFWQQAMVLAAVLMGVGLAESLNRLPEGMRRVAAALFAIGIPAALALAHVRAIDPRDDHRVQDYGRAILESVPPNAILLIIGDTPLGSVRYAQEVEGMRRDVRLIPTSVVHYPWYRKLAARTLPGVQLPPQETFTCRQLLDANAGRPICLVGREPWMESLEESYSPWSLGLVEVVLPRDQPPEIPTWIRDAESGFARFDAAAASRQLAGSDAHELSVEYWKNYQRFGQALARAGPGHAGDPAALRTIVSALERVVERHPDPAPALLKDLGIGYRVLSAADAEAKHSMVRHWRRYLAFHPADPETTSIRILIEREGRVP